ncbi:sodium-dependent glucose transporter 1-like protein [Leptotrombidium deliense]|uniref:Major facilitator superfamily domain-containing protein 4A n=1 Tax=Leptotrombidium deliense TaxID=299467 RepID=A0A443S2L9_9ACAR|nr:sodium-dependent glucose transporter 1-like protein [Leptotrombidium deliense]
MGVTMLLIPIIPRYAFFLILSCGTGFALGGTDTASNVLILEMWGKDNNAYLQAVHLSFAVGQVIGPLMCTPFVSQPPQTPVESKIVVPFAITAATAFLSAIALFVFELFMPYITPERSMSRRDEINLETDSLIPRPQRIPKSYYFTVVTLASLALFMLLSTEPQFFNFLPTFLQRINVETITSMYMCAVFGGSFTFFRFLSIFVALKVKAALMLYAFLSLSLISSVVMLVLGLNSILVLWITCATSGAGFACLHAAILSFVEERIDVTNIIGGVFMFTGAAGKIISPLIIGHFIENKPFVFVDCYVFCITAMIIAFVLLHCTDIWKANCQ